LATVPGVAAAAEAPGQLGLRVLYIGNNKDRAAAYAEFLQRHFAKAMLAQRDNFNPAAARDADVVLLDWSQSETNVQKARSPLGRPEDWSKPTVLLGSAGLIMAGQWQLIGGAG
jgi:hypothetical protein